LRFDKTFCSFLILISTNAPRAADPPHPEAPLRERVVYTAIRPVNWDLYLFDAPGEPPRRLTTHPALDYNATFSPDGRWVVFCSERRGSPDLYILDLEKGGVPRLLVDSEALEDAPAFSPDGQSLVFISSREGNAEIFSMPFRPEVPDASAEAVNLTRNKGGDFNPAFSPDGQWIAFASDRDHYRASEIYVMRTDGSEVERLTLSDGWDGSPAWSTDGALIYFYSQRDDGLRLYRMKSDGSDQRSVFGLNQSDQLSPSPAPGGRIGFTKKEEAVWRIFSTDKDGSDLRMESDNDRDYWAPAFDMESNRMICHGPGGDQTAPVLEDGNMLQGAGVPGPFIVDNNAQIELPDRRLELWAVRVSFPSPDPAGRRLLSSDHFKSVLTSSLEGAGLRRVFHHASPPLSVFGPRWSKDGQWIACAVGPTFAEPGARVDIWKFRPDGGDAVNLTADSTANDGFPDFSPDDRQIVFRSDRDGDKEIYLMNSDGTGLLRLTDNEAIDTMPAFSPLGDMIAFASDRNGDFEVYTLKLNRDQVPGEARRVTHSPGRDVHPKFSPDGKWLVFASERGGLNDEEPLIPVFNPQPYGEIFTVRLSDGYTIRLTHNKWEDGVPSWSSPGY